MCDAGKSSGTWFDVVRPKITASLGQDFDGGKYEVSVPADSLYLSSTYYVTIRVPASAEVPEDKTASIVIKRPTPDELMRELIKSDSQFHNEILFYRRYAQDSEDFPRSIYLEEKPPTDTVIALENVGGRGYELCPCLYDVPLEYTLAAMREIGRFHGRGYVMKERQREKFFDIVQEIHETRFENTPDNPFMEFINLMSTRVVEYFRKKNYDKTFCDKLETFLENAFENVMAKSAVPVEPLATMCHGDFTMNNTLYKRDNGNLKAMLIDFALIRYGPPSIDLSTFFCLCCPKQLKNPDFEHVLRTYHDSLKQYLVENELYDESKYSYEAFLNDHKERGLFGFIIASFYLAVQMGKQALSPNDVANMGMKAAAAISRQAGGDEISEILANMLMDLKELGCLDHVL